jgi:membrane protein DedA with SNARE-associated domain
MSLGHITQLILEYRYFILIPLTFLEGPIVAFVAGTLASVGYFNIYALGGLFFVRDVGMDFCCYVIGYYGWQWRWVRRIAEKAGITDSHVGEVRHLWHHHGFKTMFFSKLSYGIAAAFVIVAGMVKTSLKRFMAYGATVTVLQYGTLLLLGYFLGTAFGGTIDKVLSAIQYILIIMAVGIIGYVFFQRYMRRRLEKAEAEAGKEHQQEPSK